MRDDEHRHPVTRQVAHDHEYLADELRVERAEVVVEHHVRVDHERPGDRDPLLLTAESWCGYCRAFSSRPTRASSSCARVSACARHLPDPPRREREVVDHLQVWEQVELLEHDPDPLADRRRIGPAPRDLLSPRKIRPESTGSSRFTQRSRVDLPLPLGPMMVSTSPVSTSRSMPSSTRLSPKLLRTASRRTSDWDDGTGDREYHAPDQSDPTLTTSRGAHRLVA